MSCRRSLGVMIDTHSGIDFKIRTIEVDGKKIKLQIWDTAGQERFRTITTAYYRGAMGIMLVYDITQPKTYHNIKHWLRNIVDHANSDVEQMLLGNKCDMESQRQIKKEEAEEFARQNNIYFYETSAKEGENVIAAFTQLASHYAINRNANEPRPSSIVTPRQAATRNMCDDKAGKVSPPMLLVKMSKKSTATDLGVPYGVVPFSNPSLYPLNAVIRRCQPGGQLDQRLSGGDTRLTRIFSR
ncbi:Ras-related protein Rab-8B [Hymenolepis weldensis]